MTTDATKNYRQSTNQPNQKQNGPGERPVEAKDKKRDTNDQDVSTRGDHRGQKASDNRLDTTKNAASEHPERQAEREDERYDDDDFGQANDVTAAAREDDEGSHEPGQSRGSMSSDRGLRTSHAQNRASVSEQEERITRRPNRKESEQTNQR